MNRLKNKFKGWALYRPDRKAAGNGIRDFYGTSYSIHTDGSLRRVGPKMKHCTKA